MLDLLDKELERRGHKFCRYADDCNVYVRSKKAGIRVMQSLTNFIEKKLKLKVNRNKSAVDRDFRRTFLGFSFTHSRENPRIRVSKESIQQFKYTVRKLTRMGKYTSTDKMLERIAQYCKGWLAYFEISQAPSPVRKLEKWIRPRLRAAFWKQWKTPKNRYKQLRKLGIRTSLAGISAKTNKGKTRMSLGKALCIGLRNSYFYERGIPKFNCRAC